MRRSKPWKRLFRLWHRNPEADVDAELRFHFDERVAELTSHGATPADAHARAVAEFGDVPAVRTALLAIDHRLANRDRRAEWWERTIQDFRIALRGFRRSPTFALTAVLILGLAIGVTVAMTTVFDAILVQRLPMRDQDRLVELYPYHDVGSELSVRPAVAEALNRQSTTMVAAASFAHYGAFAWPLTDGDRSVVLPQTVVSGNFFEVLGAKPALGRLLRPADDVRGAGHFMVISYDAWQHVFGGDPAIVGHRLTYAPMQWAYTIIGVAPPGLDYPAGVGCWTAIVPSSYDQVHVVARLAPGATPAAARSEFLSVASQLARDQGRSATTAASEGYAGAEVHTLPQVILGSVQPLLIVLTAAVALLLLIACVNVGNLLVLRAAERSRELAVRRALGATFGDLMRQLLVESSALGILGGALGLACAHWLLHLLVIFAPAQLPRADVIRLAGAPTATTLGVTLVSVLIFGVAPAFLAAGASASSSLRLGTRSGSATRTRIRFKQMMVAAQVALTLVLLIGAALLGRTLERLERLNLGYDAGHLAMLELSEPVRIVQTVPAVLATTEKVIAQLRAVPGVAAVTPVIVPPFISGSVWRWKFDAEGQTEEQVADDPSVPVEMGGSDYFRTFAIPITSGRGFAESDRADAPLVAVVSQSVAHRFWPGESAVGKRIRVPATPTNTSGWEHGGQWRTVVGVAGDIRYRSLRDATPMVYLPWRQGIAQGFFAVRSSADLASILPAARRALREINPDLRLWRARTMDDLLAGPLAQPRLATVVMTGFGVASLLLAAIGLYGVMASTVRERTRDIGVRIALGATPGRVRGEVVRQMLGTFGLGALTGLAAAFALSRLLTKLLFEVSPADPLAFAMAGAVLLIVSLGAAFVPARRATGIDPAQALRAE